MLDSLQKLLPWAAGLPLLPKVAITAVVVLISFVFLYLVWMPEKRISVDEHLGVEQAYDRMKKVLARIESGEEGRVFVDGNLVDPKLTGYYYPYLKIAEYLRANPGNIEGAYETVWENGGSGRVHTSDTQVFEAVVSGFFHEWELARGSKSQLENGPRTSLLVDQPSKQVEEPHRIWVQSHERGKRLLQADERRPEEGDTRTSQAESFYRLGLLRQGEGNHVAAIELFDKATEMSPAYSKPIIAKAISLEQLGRWEEAFRTYEAADSMVSNPHTYGSIITNLAATLQAAGKLQEAAITYERALKILSETGYQGSSRWFRCHSM